MAGQHRKVSSARRRGTSIAATALGLSLVAGGVQPVLAPETADFAQAQLRTEAQRSLVKYPRSTAVRFGQTTTASPNVNRLTAHPPVSYEIASSTDPNWGASVDPETGEVTITPNVDAGEDLPQSGQIDVLATFKDDSTKILPVAVTLAQDPYFDPVNDATFWVGKDSNPIHVRGVFVPSGYTLAIDENTIPPGMVVDDSRALNRFQHVYLMGAPSEAGVYEVTAKFVGTDGSTYVGAGGELLQTFTVTVKDPADLPAPVEADLADEPQEPVEAGQELNIPVNTENAASVEVSGLPDGVTYDSENSTITGTPTTPGEYEAVVDIITKDEKVQQDRVKISVKDPAATSDETTPAEPTTEPSTSGETTPAEPTTEPSTSDEPTTGETTPVEPTTGETTPVEPTTSGEATTEPSTSEEPTSDQPTTDPSTSGEPTTGETTPVEPTSGASTSDQPTTEPSTSGEPTTERTTDPTATDQPTTGEPTPADPTVGESSTSEPTAGETTAAPTDQGGVYEWKPIIVKAGNTAAGEPEREPAEPVVITADADAPEWVTVNQDGRIDVNPPRGTAPGTYSFGVTTATGERDTITVEVTALDADNTRVEMEYNDDYLRAGETASNQPPRANITRDGVEYAKQPMLKGTKFALANPDVKPYNESVDPETGAVTVTAPIDQVADAPIEVEILVTYPDGTTATVVATFYADPAPLNQTNQPVYEQGKGAQPGRTVSVKQIAFLPDETEFSLADPTADFKGWDIRVNLETGEILATAPEVDPQPIDVQIRATYTDGTIDQEGRQHGETTTVHIDALTGTTLADTVEGSNYSQPVYDADGNILIYPTGSLPEGATFEVDGLTALPVEVDPETGAIKIVVPADAPANAPFDVPIKLVLPDGSTQEIVVPVATRSDASGQVVSWAPIKLTEGGEPVTVAPTTAPEGVTFGLAASFDAPGWQVLVDERTGAVTASHPGSDADTLATLIPVVVTFPDGSQRIMDVPATVVRGEAALNDVTYAPAEINAGGSVTINPDVVPGSFSLVSPVPGLGLTIDPATGALTVTAQVSALAGTRDVPVEVTFADGSRALTSARITVLDDDTAAATGTGSSNGSSEGSSVGSSSSSSSSSVGNSAFVWIPALLAVLGLLGTAGKQLYDNREFFQDFLVWWK